MTPWYNSRMAESSSRAPLIALRLPHELNDRLRAHSEATGSSISDVVRGAIETELAGGKAAPVKAAKRGAVSRCEHRQPSGAFCASCDSIVP